MQKRLQANLEYGIDDSVEISINDEEDIIHNRMKMKLVTVFLQKDTYQTLAL